MTPVETAQKIIGNFYTIEDSKTNDDAWIDYYLSIRCAQVAVDEILAIAYWKYMESGGEKEENYWREVKHELEYLQCKCRPK